MKSEAKVALGLEAHLRMEPMTEVLLVALLKTSLLEVMLVIYQMAMEKMNGEM